MAGARGRPRLWPSRGHDYSQDFEDEQLRLHVLPRQLGCVANIALIGRLHQVSAFQSRPVVMCTHEVGEGLE